MLESSNSSLINVWDPLVRFFHWSLVIAFIVAYITEDDFLDIHTIAGYFILFLILSRILWGLVGTRYARFADFIYSPKTIKQFISDSFSFKAKRYIGHNPAGGAMIILLMISLLVCTITGIAVYGAEEHAGPMASWFINNSSFWGEALEEVHEFFANFILFLIVIHIFGVVVESFVHQENLARAMVTGKKIADKTPQ